MRRAFAARCCDIATVFRSVSYWVLNSRILLTLPTRFRNPSWAMTDAPPTAAGKTRRDQADGGPAMPGVPLLGLVPPGRGAPSGGPDRAPREARVAEGDGPAA